MNLRLIVGTPDKTKAYGDSPVHDIEECLRGIGYGLPDASTIHMVGSPHAFSMKSLLGLSPRKSVSLVVHDPDGSLASYAGSFTGQHKLVSDPGLTGFKELSADKSYLIGSGNGALALAEELAKTNEIHVVASIDKDSSDFATRTSSPMLDETYVTDRTPLVTTISPPYRMHGPPYMYLVQSDVEKSIPGPSI